MKRFFIKIIFLCIAFPFFLSCQTTNVKEKTQIEVPKTEKSKAIKIEDMNYFFLAGDNLWVFFGDRFEIVKNPTEKKVIFFKRFESEVHCPTAPPSPASAEEEAALGLTPGTFIPTINDGLKDCIPRPPRYNFGMNQYNIMFQTGYWVLDNEVVIQLGKQLYFFTYDGKFLRIESRKKGWQFEKAPFSKYDWRYNEKGFHFKGKTFEPGNPAVFSGPWALRKKGRFKKKKLYLIDRATAEYRHYFEATSPTRGLDLIEYREYGAGFYIDRRRSPRGFRNDIQFPTRRPAWWFGKTVIDLKNDDPTTHCYVFKEKKKCIPISTPCTLVNGKQKCIPLSKRSYPKQSLRGVLETDKMLIRVYDEELNIEFK